MNIRKSLLLQQVNTLIPPYISTILTSIHASLFLPLRSLLGNLYQALCVPQKKDHLVGGEINLTIIINFSKAH
jgi:hypothetical protein